MLGSESQAGPRLTNPQRVPRRIRRMTRALFISFVAVALAGPAYADVTLKQTTSGKGLGMSGTTPAVTYIKGNKMRSDTTVGDRTQSMIFDLDAQKLYMFDSRKKEADVYDMESFSKEISTSVDTENMKVSMKPNGQTKQIAGQTATGYDLEITIPAAMGGNKDMKMTMTLSGPTWIVKGAPGTQDYVNFYKAAVEKGWIFSDPRAAKGQPGQAKAMAEMYRQLAEAGGIAYETEMQLKMGGGGGPMAGLLARMGNMSFTTRVEAVETGPLSDDLFAPPAGYKLNQRK
jgi:hypothetical protein